LNKYTGHTICASQKAVVTIIYLNENDRCLKIVQYQISWKFVQWYWSCYMFTDKQMDSDFNRLCSNV